MRATVVVPTYRRPDLLDRCLAALAEQEFDPADCEVVVDDTGASRRHAQVRTIDGVSTLTDLGSTNGTKVNGRDVQTAQLADGDHITVGTTQIEYRSA